MSLPKQYIDNHGRSIKTGARLGAGGEADVFAIVDDPKLVAKIYHRPPDAEKVEKLRAMVNLCCSELETISGWPCRLLTDGQSTRGIVMPFISGYHELQQLYIPVNRKKHFPKADYAFIVQVAMNLAAAVENMHRRGFVIGDVNQKNILINHQALVKLVDCDSYQLRYQGKEFRCEVGVGQFTPPELHGVNFKHIARTGNHDNFGLAIMIFHLLMMGRHPYHGVSVSGAITDPDEPVRQFRYAYAKNSAVACRMVPPPASPPMELLPERIRNLLERSFLRGSEQSRARTSAVEWHAALGEMLKSMQACAQTNEHRFPGHLRSCVWCDASKMGTAIYFIATARVATRGTLLVGGRVIKLNLADDLDQKVRELETLLGTSSGKYAGTMNSSVPMELLGSKRLLMSLRWCAGLAFILTVSQLSGPLAPLVDVVLFLWWCSAECGQNGYLYEKRQRKHTLDEAAKRVLGLRMTLVDKQASISEKAKSHLQRSKSASKNMRDLVKKYETERNQLPNQARELQERAFLEKYSIERCMVNGIGSALKDSLRSFGIETAADLEKSAILAVPGFGIARAEVLMEWRRSLLQQFRFDPSKGVPQSQVDDFEAKFSQLVRAKEAELKSVLAEADVILSALRRASGNNGTALELALKSLAKAKADHEAILHL